VAIEFFHCSMQYPTVYLSFFATVAASVYYEMLVIHLYDKQVHSLILASQLQYDYTMTARRLGIVYDCRNEK